MTDKNSTRYAIVTGGGSGLGREFCRLLAAGGYHIAIVGRHRERLEETLQIVKKAGGNGRIEECDVTDPTAWHALRDQLQPNWPRLDLLVNNAGMFASDQMGQLDLAELERVVRLNLFGAIFGCDTMVPWLEKAPQFHPRIINVSSIYAYLCPPGMTAYNVSKAGVVALSETLHGELRPRGIGVTVVCPGPMPTQFVNQASFASPDFRRMTERFVRDSKLTPARVAAAALRASARRQLYVMMGTDQRWLWRLKRWFPVLLLDRVALRVRKDLKNVAPPASANNASVHKTSSADN